MEKKLSKTISYFLRHAPEEAGLEMDEFGFVSLEKLAEALRDRGWTGLVVDELAEKIKAGGSKRFEVMEGKVRAKYGHSRDIKVDRLPLKDPGTLYHGTSPGAWRSIKEEGIKPQNRPHVHLSATVDEAYRVGQRHAADPVILVIEPPSSASDKFYQAAENVVLTDYVPPEWITGTTR